MCQPGYMDNSPTLLLKKPISGKKIILLTANGSRGVVNSKDSYATEVLVGCFLNAAAIAEYLRDSNNITLVPMGDCGNKEPEDELCAEYVRDLILGKEPREEEIRNRIIESGSVQYLVDRERGDDAELCLRFNELPVVPKLIGDRLIGI